MARLSKDIYLTTVLPQIPHILSQLDRRAASPTKGCFDREYWHYLAVDFPCMEKQESALTLYLLYAIDHPLNRYKGNHNLLGLLKDAVNFWCYSQRPNGSFDEWYPYENSVTATAFSTYCITESLIKTKDHIIWDEKAYYHVSKAAKWIARHNEHIVSNQEAGAILALYNAAKFTQDAQFQEAADRKLEILLSLQDEEGWFPEYGGADVGYSSVTLAYLAKIWKIYPGEKLTAALEKLASFIGNFVHLDSSLGGYYGSRNTEYILPLGAEILASTMPIAAELAAKLRLALTNRFDIGLRNVDHRYLLFHNYFYLQSYVEARDFLDAPTHNARNFHFKNAGIIGRGDEDRQFIVSVLKGGVFKIASHDVSLTDCGWAVSESGKILISSYLNSKIENHCSLKFVTVSGKLKRAPVRKMNTIALVMFRICMITLGRLEPLSRLIKKIGRSALIINGRVSRIGFKRNIMINETEIIVTDAIEGLNKNHTVYLGGNFAYAFGPSTGTFQSEQLTTNVHAFSPDDYSDGHLVVERHFLWDTKLKLLKINGSERFLGR